MANSDLRDLHNLFFKELRHWYFTGSTNDDLAHINPTLFSPFVHSWSICPLTCPFDGYLPIQRKEIERCGSLTNACKKVLKILVEQFKEIRVKTTLKVTPWIGDGLALCTGGFLKNQLFDIIDTSNVIDYCGLLNILVCCRGRLKIPLESQLLTSTMNWVSECKSIEEFYNMSIGVDPSLLPTVLGLKLAEDFDLGSRTLPKCTTGGEETLHWVRIDQPKTLLNIDERSDIVQALQALVERCFNHNCNLVEIELLHSYGECGINLSSPITLLRIVDQLHPLIEGGAARIFKLVHGRLPSDFDKKFGLTWNLIKASTGTEQRPIVEVRVRIGFSLQPQAKIIPMVLILDENHLRSFNQMALFQKKYPVIYKSLRYDKDKDIITFHLLKSDWSMIKNKSWIKIVSSDCSPSIDSETVFLGNDVVVKEVEPVDTFGLISRQLIEIIKVEESKHFYTAELAVTNARKCKAEKICTIFEPEDCPTSVNINFADVNGCTLNFSCPVIKNSCTFQFLNEQKKITCKISKKHDGTVGERVLKNPGLIPFHALPLWNDSFSVNDVCGKMFRSIRDSEMMWHSDLKNQFFYLRESISVIFENCFKQFDSEIPKVFCLTEATGPITETDIFGKQVLVIKVEKIYEWKHLPLAKVLFFECKGVDDWIIKNGSAFLQSAIVIESNVKELDLFCKMLEVNAVRTGQDGLSDSMWMRSFISTVFPQEKWQETDIDHLYQFTQSPIFNFFSRKFFQDMDQDKCSFCQRNSETLKKCMGCKMAHYCSKECQRRHWTTEHKNSCEHQSTEQKSSPGDVNKAKCCFCKSKSENVRKCSRCKKVSYCSQVCQERHWELGHKKECQTEKDRKSFSFNYSGDVDEVKCTFCKSKSENLRKCSRCKKMSYCTQDCQKRHWNLKHKKECQTEKDRKSFSFSPSGEVDEAKCTFCKSKSENLRKCSRCKKVSYCSQICQERHWKLEHKKECQTEKDRKSFSFNPSGEVDEAKCSFCKNKSENLRKCSRCKKVSYCSQDCQERHWKLNHKKECQISNENNSSSGPRKDVKDAKCETCESKSENLMKCSRCKKVFYCSGDCQQIHWRLGHKMLCQKA